MIPLALLLAASAALAQPPDPIAGLVRLQAPAACEVGARCDVGVEVTCPEASRCTLDTPGRLGAFEVLQVASAPARDGGGTAWRLTLIAFEPGAVTLPPLVVRVVRDDDGRASMATSPEVGIDVRLPGGDEGDELRGAAGPIDPGPDWRVVAAWGAGAIAALAVVEVIRRRRRRTAPAVPRTAPAPTLDQVIDRIRALEREPAASPDEVLALYRRLSDELRKYAASALAAPAEALTSQELVRTIEATPRGRAHSDRDRVVLEGIDLVKFGGDRPEPGRRSRSIAGAVELVRSLPHRRQDTKGTDRGVA